MRCLVATFFLFALFCVAICSYMHSVPFRQASSVTNKIKNNFITLMHHELLCTTRPACTQACKEALQCDQVSREEVKMCLSAPKEPQRIWNVPKAHKEWPQCRMTCRFLYRLQKILLSSS